MKRWIRSALASGLRGQRVKNIVRELNNEKVDIIKWDQVMSKTYIANALAPAKLRALRGG